MDKKDGYFMEIRALEAKQNELENEKMKLRKQADDFDELMRKEAIDISNIKDEVAPEAGVLRNIYEEMQQNVFVARRRNEEYINDQIKEINKRHRIIDESIDEIFLKINQTDE